MKVGVPRIISIYKLDPILDGVLLSVRGQLNVKIDKGEEELAGGTCLEML